MIDIEMMRRELENPKLMEERIKREKDMMLIVDYAKNMMKEDGKDFDEEFKKYKEDE